MFTLSDIRHIAIQIERNGESTYRKAGEKTADAELARMLNWMADEERRHIEWFKALPTDAKTDGAHQEVEQMGRALLQEMMKSQTFSLEDDRLDKADNIISLLNQSLSFEQDTILFYEMLASFIDDANILDQLDRIIAEERTHVTQIERMQRSFTKIRH